MPTRGRHEMANLAIRSLFEKCSKHENFKIYILCDRDDEANSDKLKKAAKDLPNLIYYENQHTKTMGEMVNELQDKAHVECDIFIPFPDDYEIVTQNWDLVILEKFAFHKKLPACCYFNDSIVPASQATFTVLNKSWVETVGRYVTNYFPFWFDDVWIDEVAQMAGLKERINISVNCLSGKGKTPRMKNLPFWNSFFRNTIQERLADADKLICKAYTKMPNKLNEQKAFATRYASTYFEKVYSNESGVLTKWEKELSDDSSFWKINMDKLIKYYLFEAKAVTKLLSLMDNPDADVNMVSKESLFKNISISEIATKDFINSLRKYFSRPFFTLFKK